VRSSSCGTGSRKQAGKKSKKKKQKNSVEELIGKLTHELSRLTERAQGTCDTYEGRGQKEEAGKEAAGKTMTGGGKNVNGCRAVCLVRGRGETTVGRKMKEVGRRGSPPVFICGREQRRVLHRRRGGTTRVRI